MRRDPLFQLVNLRQNTLFAGASGAGVLFNAVLIVPYTYNIFLK